MTETLQSIEIQCENGGTDYIALGTDSEEKPKDAKLKAIGKYTCDTGSGGNLSEKDITSMVAWASADETVAKVNSGAVEATGSGVASIRAAYDGKTSNILEAYVNSCPLSQTSSQSSDDFEPLYTQASRNTSVFDINIAQAQNTMTCKGCSPYKEESLCKFVTGDRKADFAFVVVPVNTAITITGQPCDGSREAWSGTRNPPGFDSVVGEFIKTMSLMSSDPQRSYFALYRADKAFESDGIAFDEIMSKCSELKNRKLVSFAFIQKGTSKEYDAYARRDTMHAWYCNSSASYAVFGHEQIGHVIGQLDDEYYDYGKATPPDIAHYNCTADSTCKKWQSIGGKQLGGCHQECNYSSVYFRSSENSIMRSANGSPGFSKLQLHIINYRLKNWPNMPADLGEFFP